MKWYLEKQTDTDFQKDNTDRITAVKNDIAAPETAASSVERTRIGGKATEKEMESLQRALLDRNVALSEALRLLIGDEAERGEEQAGAEIVGVAVHQRQEDLEAREPLALAIGLDQFQPLGRERFHRLTPLRRSIGCVGRGRLPRTA